MSLRLLHLHLHGLIRSKNLELGRDSDTGGQTCIGVNKKFSKFFSS